MKETPSPQESVVEIEALDVEWDEVVRHADGTVEHRRRRLRSRRRKIEPMWLVIALLVVVTAMTQPELLATAWETVSRIWPRAG